MKLALVFLIFLALSVSYKFEDDDDDDSENENEKGDDMEYETETRDEDSLSWRRSRFFGRRRRRRSCKPKPTVTKQAFPTWRALAVTYRKFTKMPMSTSQARKEWVLDVDACKADTFFVGRRYVFKQSGPKSGWDRSTLLLFDARGRIAGIQMQIPKGQRTPSGRFPPVVEGDAGNRYLTAYFTDPVNICNRRAKRDSSMVGDRLLILHSTKTLPKGNLLNIPLKENWIDGTLWQKGGCVPAMGRHYFYNLSPGMNCNDFMPIFLLYNNNNLNGFGWTLAGQIPSATARLEYGPTAILNLFFKPFIPWPQCLNTTVPVVSSQHVYLDSNPTQNRC